MSDSPDVPSDAAGHDAYGTAAANAPVGRADFERAVRALNMSDVELRDAVLNLAARVVALTDELTRRIDGVEPQPAPPGTAASPATATVEDAVGAALPETLRVIRANDARSATRVSLDLGASKYATPSAPVPCEELIPLCGGRCCTLSFSLSTEDLDEGVIRWDYGQPYLIRQRTSDGYCVHSDPDTRACTVHHYRPRVCRGYDCRNDKRVWIDYEQRIPAPRVSEEGSNDMSRPASFDLLERARARALAVKREMTSLNESFAEAAPRRGPRP